MVKTCVASGCHEYFHVLNMFKTSSGLVGLVGCHEYFHVRYLVDLLVCGELMMFKTSLFWLSTFWLVVAPNFLIAC